jgi:hypothetical protein
MPTTNDINDNPKDEPKRRLAVSEYSAPAEINLRERRLFWQPVEHYRKVRPTVDTFTRFVGLTEVSDREILKYAQKWGVLNLCETHKSPSSHDPLCRPIERRGQPRGEPLSEWRRFSRSAGAIVRIGLQLDENKPGSVTDWDLLKADPAFALLLMDAEMLEARRVPQVVAAEKAVIANVVNEWLRMGNVRPHLTWGVGEPSVSLAGGVTGGLFGALGVQLVERTGDYLIASCSGCRKFYHPEKKPRSGQDRYCQTCRDAGVPVAKAKHRKAVGTNKPRKTKSMKRGKRK